MKVRHQLSYEYELLQGEHDFANAHIRLRMIAILDEHLTAFCNRQDHLL